MVLLVSSFGLRQPSHRHQTGNCRRGAHRIERSFRFRNFREALTFVQEVGELAESEGHHPNIGFGWGNATVSLQTKKIKGLHENDFIMATKIDRIFARTAAG
jgi:4a-hydroxytetrahydrobiopterin dehydratase